MLGGATAVAAPARIMEPGCESSGHTPGASLIPLTRHTTYDLRKAFAPTMATPGPVDPKSLGIGKCIVDTGCGHNLVDMGIIQRSGHQSDIVSMGRPITLQTAGGPSASKGGLKVATPSLDEGEFTALIMPNSPSVLSVGERCLDHGYGFHWPRGESVPFLETPSGKRIQLEVEGKIPYLDVSEAVAEEVFWDPGCPGAAGSSNDTLRLDRVAWKATKNLDVPSKEPGGGPPVEAILRRVTLDLHSREVLERLEVSSGMSDAVFTQDIAGSPRDILVYWYYDSKAAAAKGWNPGPLVNKASGKTAQPSSSGGAPSEPAQPIPVGNASGSKSPASPAGGEPSGPPLPVEGQGTDADDADASCPNGFYGEDDDAEPKPRMSAQQLKEEATSVRHLLTHIPKNPYCKACMQAKALPPQSRKAKNKSQFKWKRPDAKVFGDEVTCDHWIAQDDVSRGLLGETVALTLRDRATNWLECQGMQHKSTDLVYRFLVNLAGPEEKLRYFYTDGAAELANAIDMLGVAKDTSQPENKKQNARAERSNRHICGGDPYIAVGFGGSEPVLALRCSLFCVTV